MTGSEELAPVPPLSRGSSRRRARPLLAATATLLAATWLLATGATLAARRTAGASGTVAAATAGATSMSLSSQTSFVSGPSGLRLTLAVHSALPDSRLGLNVVLYSRLGSRDAFVETLGGVEPASEYPLDSPSTIPLGSLRHHGTIRLHLPVTTASGPPSGKPASPTLALDCPSGTCPGVYPLELVLLDRARDVALASLTTDLIYAPPTSGALPLEVGLVLPLGGRPGLSPQGASLLSGSRLVGLEQLLRAVDANPETPLNLALHAQLLDALDRSHAKAAHLVLSELAGLVGNEQPGQAYRHELLGVPFAGAAVDALASAGLGDQLGAQLAAQASSVRSVLHSTAARNPYLASAGLDAAGLALLRRNGVRSVVVPPSSVSSAHVPLSTPTAPFVLSAADETAGTAPARAGAVPAGKTEAFLADPGLATAYDAAGRHPVLAAHQLLAELASVYFDDPFSQEARGVVVAPRVALPSERFLSTFLAGLAASPILRASTLSTMTASIPIGANGMPTNGSLVAHHDKASRALGAKAVRAAETSLQTLRSVVPSATTLSARLGESILLGESANLTRAARARFEAAPLAALRRIGHALSLPGSRTTTLTSRSGRIPITVQSAMAVPVHVVLRLHSSDLTFAANRSVLELPLDLTGKASQSDVKVSTRTSGSSRLDIALVSPRNGFVLVDESIAVHSTAISGVAVALSAGALAVLLAWWLRSFARHRRARAARAETAGGPT